MSDKAYTNDESSENNPVGGYVCESCGSEFDTSPTADYNYWDAPERDENGWVINCTGCYANGVIVYDSEKGGVKRRHNMVQNDHDDDDTDADNIWVAAEDDDIIMTDGGRDLDSIHKDIQMHFADYHDDLLESEHNTLIHETDDAYYMLFTVEELDELTIPIDDWSTVVDEKYTPQVDRHYDGETGDLIASDYPVVLDKAMADMTARDRAWMVIIDALQNQSSIKSQDVMDRANISRPVAKRVLHAAEYNGLLKRETDHSHTYKPAMWLVRSIEDPSYQRAVETLIEEA